jgi:hypothetical protein
MHNTSLPDYSTNIWRREYNKGDIIIQAKSFNERSSFVEANVL